MVRCRFGVFVCVAVIAAGVLSGCSAQQSNWCWRPTAGRSTCLDLVSVQGQEPSGQTVSLPGVMKLSINEPSTGNAVWLTGNINGCWIWSVPARVNGDVWYPDANQLSMDITSCILDPGDDDYSWILNIFYSPFRLEPTDGTTVRIVGADQNVDFQWGNA